MNAEFLFYCKVCSFIFILSFFLVVKFLEDLSDKSAEIRTQELTNKLLEEYRNGKKPTN